MIGQPIEVETVFKTYRAVRRREVRALLGMSFSVERGRVFGLIGPNGSGKTTIMQIIVGLLRQDRGDVRLGGKDPSDPTARRNVGYLPENFQCYPFLTVRQAVALYTKLIGVADATAIPEAAQLLELAGLDGVLDRRVAGFSKGMMQRLGLVQALLGQPEILVLDEPNTGLDPDGRATLRDLIASERSRGTTVLLSTHSLADAERVCDDLAIVANGTTLYCRSMCETMAALDDRWQVEFRASSAEPGALQSLPGITQVVRDATGTWLVTCDSAAKHATLERLFLSGHEIVSVTRDPNALDRFYRSVIGGTHA